jgi:hypothetical protein
MDASFLRSASLVQIAPWMAVVGLALGVAFYLQTRFGRPPSSAYERGQEDIWRLTAKPLIVIGLVAAVIWIVAVVR